MSDREYLIDASAYWRIDRCAVLAAAWRDHPETILLSTACRMPSGRRNPYLW